MGKAFAVSVNTAEIDAMFDGLESDVTSAARPAANAMAWYCQQEVLKLVSAPHMKTVTGNLKSSIYRAFDQKSAPGKPSYAISWNHRKAPHGHLVEFGHLMRYEVSYDPKTKRFTTHKDKPLATPKQVGARPFIRPVANKFAEVQAYGVARFWQVLEQRGVVK